MANVICVPAEHDADTVHAMRVELAEFLAEGDIDERTREALVVACEIMLAAETAYRDATTGKGK